VKEDILWGQPHLRGDSEEIARCKQATTGSSVLPESKMQSQKKKLLPSAGARSQGSWVPHKRAGAPALNSEGPPKGLMKTVNILHRLL
jgi:hypothetical protein